MGAGDSKHRTSLRPQDRPLPPGKPTLVPGTPGTDPDVITIKWESPEWNGGAKITGYSVEHRRTGSPHWVRATPVQIRQHQLTLSGLEPGMRYQFRVFADSSAGRSEPSPLSEPIAVSYHRTFASAPCFIKPLHDTVAIENEKVEFTVQVQGTPAPKLVWYKDGFEVYSSRRQRIVTENDTSSLVIHQAAFRDEGEIKCSATNKAGHVVTKAQLRLEAPPTIRLPRQYEDGLLFELGETVRLKISVTGRPQPQVHWLHDGEEVVTGGKQEIITTERYTTLKVLEATRQDRGEYQVKAVNRLGEDLVSFLVTITDRPLPPGKAHVVMTLGRCVTLSWSAPSDDGGCKIGNYIVEYYRIGWNMWLKAATCRQLTTTLGDLIEGSEYKFRVKAENPYGISEPSDESDVIFIPDPKRGLLEPPARDGKLLLNEEMTEEWLEARKKHNELVDDRTKIKYSGEQERKGIDWEDESPIPSPVMLANQVLRKVKMAPKRGWSEDSQASPPRSPEHPVPPQRKSRLKHMKAINEYSKNVKDTSPDVIEKIEYHSTRNVKNAEESLHSSSELMLVLVPNSRADTEERETEWKDTVDSLKNSNSLIAPPMSLSAPELGSCEPVDFSLMRYSVSSTELLHERAMARFYQENTERENENELKKRYGIERKRSFERRSPKPRIEIFAKEQSFSAEIHSEGSNHPHKESMKNEEEGCSPLSNIDASKCVTAKDNNSDRFIQSEKVFKELIADSYEPNNEYKLAGERDSEKRNKHSPTRIDDYFSDESDEDTYHPNMASRTGVMSSGPLTLVVNPTARGSEQHNTIDDSLEFNEPDKSIMDEEGQGIEVDTKFPPIEEYVLANQSNNTVTQSQPLKPILKVRDYPQENRTKTRLFVSKLMKIPPTEPLVRESCSTSDESKTRKKVRIEEPDEKYAEELVGEGDRDVLLTGEVARNRRKQIRQNLSGEEVDPTRVMISHYSDIVREFGYGKKPRAKLYLDYEDLKAAADRVETEIEEEVEEDDLKDTEETKCAITHAQNEGVVPFAQTDNCNENISAVIEVVTIKVPQEEIAKKPKSSLYFLVDIILFLVACWIYMFNDERLAIPIMFLMIYRQMHEFIQRKFKKWKKT